jgi:hypothetical protein
MQSSPNAPTGAYIGALGSCGCAGTARPRLACVRAWGTPRPLAGVRRGRRCRSPRTEWRGVGQEGGAGDSQMPGNHRVPALAPARFGSEGKTRGYAMAGWI